MSDTTEQTASDFDFGNIDLTNPASYFDSSIAPETTEPSPPPVYQDSDDEFFNQEQALPSKEEGGESSEVVEGSEGESNSQEEAETSVSDEGEQTAAQEVSIDAFKKEHKFKLDPEDADLRRTLRRGIKAPKIKAELDKIQAELAEFQKPEVAEKIQVWDELKEYAAEGEYDRVMQAILGDQYDEFLDRKVSERLEYEEADPARRAEMDLDKYKRQQSWKEKQWNKEKEAQAAQEQARQEAATLDKWESYGVPALEKFGFSDSEVVDEDRRFQLNQHLWESTWSAIENYAQGDESKITPALVQKAFKRKASLLKYGSTKPVEAQVEQALEKKKEEAASTAAGIATANYPKKTEAPKGAVKEFLEGSGSIRDFMRKLR